ncbi:MFS transporter [Kribbella sp. NPDC056861]|uniref:MFS transporter n=1 Tax=Kribbella sp. NPDC056861 TaxID=3154857 RepID=UPI003446BC39
MTGALRAGRREWIGLGVLALPTLLLSLDVSVLYLALPKLSEDLGASSIQQLWILDIYSFLLAGFLVTMGRLGDRVGRRRLLLVGAAGFGVASIVAAFSSSPEMLIASRALLGLTGATLMPSTMSLIRTMFRDPAQLGQALGLWFSCFMGGMLLGPIVGGLLLARFWWGAAFLLGVPVMVLLLATGPRLLPEYRDPEAGRLDLVSVGLSLATILPVIYGLKELARGGWAPLPVAMILAGVLVGRVFVRRQNQLDHPLLDLRLFKLPRFSAALGITLAAGVVMAGVSLETAIFLQVIEGLTPLAAGLWLIPQSLAMILGLLTAPKISQRFGTSTTVAAGLVMAAAGLALLTQAGAGGLAVLVPAMALTSYGMGLPMASTMNVMMAAAPPQRAGSVASLSETSGEGGIALGIAILGSLGTAVYRQQLDSNLPAGLPSAAADAARESVNAATVVAAGLPAELGRQVADAAREAFTYGLQTVSVVGAAIFLACAVISVISLRERPAPLPSQEKTCARS